MGPFNPILATWQSGCVLSNPGMTLTSKAKVSVCSGGGAATALEKYAALSTPSLYFNLQDLMKKS